MAEYVFIFCDCSGKGVSAQPPGRERPGYACEAHFAGLETV
jgi:hypothetical protein